jgi:hypothetical protein
MLIDLLTSFVGVIATTVAIEEVHQTNFVVVVVLDLASVGRCLVDGRLSSSSPLAGFNSLLYNILPSITSGRHVALSILSLLNYILCKITKSLTTSTT